MPRYQGFWLNIRTGKAIEVEEHAEYVWKNPGTFGLTKAQIEATGYTLGNAGDERVEVCRMAFKKGWLRMRKYRESVSFQHEWTDLFDVYGAIVTFLKEHKDAVHMYDDIRVVNIASGSGFQGTAAQFLDAYEPKKGVGVGYRPEFEPEGGGRMRVFDLIRQHIFQQAGIVGDSEIPYEKKLELLAEAVETMRAQGK